MAVDYFGQEEEDENNVQQAVQQVGPQSGGVIQAGPQGGPQDNTRKGTSSGSYTNLQSYIDANRGSGFGQRFQGQVEEGISGGRRAIGEAEDKFKEAVGKGGLDEKRYTPAPPAQTMPKYETGPVRPIGDRPPIKDSGLERMPTIDDTERKAPTPGAGGSGEVAPMPSITGPQDNYRTFIDRAVGSPGQLSDEDKQKFYQLRDARYQGPQSFSDMEDLYGSTQKAIQDSREIAGLAGSEGGTKALLDKFYLAQTIARE